MSVNMAADIYRYGKSRYMCGICVDIDSKCRHTSAQTCRPDTCAVDHVQHFLFQLGYMRQL